MILISHRGNINGRIEEEENKPEYVEDAIRLGYDVEIDVWRVEDKLYLGHDKPQYEIYLGWIIDKSHKLWVHCKNIEAIEYFNQLHSNINYFWHQEDTLTLTSKHHMWVYPGKQPIKNSIAVMPEVFNDNVESCLGVCSDYVENYKKR